MWPFFNVSLEDHIRLVWLYIHNKKKQKREGRVYQKYSSVQINNILLLIDMATLNTDGPENG